MFSSHRQQLIGAVLLVHGGAWLRGGGLKPGLVQAAPRAMDYFVVFFRCLGVPGAVQARMQVLAASINAGGVGVLIP